jgi:hypothetical protein
MIPLARFPAKAGIHFRATLDRWDEAWLRCKPESNEQTDKWTPAFAGARNR